MYTTISTIAEGKSGDFPFSVKKTKPAHEVASDAPVKPLPALSEEQQVVHDYALAWSMDKLPADVQRPPSKRLLTLGGFGGTGKSTVVAHLAKLLQELCISHAFCTYTGKASQVLRRKLRQVGISPQFCGTIHSLIYEPESDSNGRVIDWRRQPELGYSLLIVDEASMLDEDIFKDLKSYRIPILAVGDHGQLPPIQGTFSLMDNPFLRLEKIHRQAEGNPIISLADTVRRTGFIPRPLLMETNPNLVVRAARGIPGSWIDKVFTDQDAAWDSAILTYTNASRTGYNEIISKKLGVGLDRGFPIQMIWLKNQKFGALKINNGQRCYLMEASQLPRGRMLGRFYFPDDNIEITCHFLQRQIGRHKTFAGLDEVQDETGFRFRSWEDLGALVDYGYALTVHKAQGDQWKNVLIEAFRPAQSDADNYRRWLYTGISRAAENCWVAAGSSTVG